MRPDDDTPVAHDSALLRRIAETVAIMLYEMEFRADGSYECLEFVGLESLIGDVPDGLSPEDAYEAAVHPDDREAYETATARLTDGEPVEVEYRLVCDEGHVRTVLDRMRPVAIAEGGWLVEGVVADITARKEAETQLLEAAEELAQAALRDPLTGLPNRKAFQDHLDVAIARAAREGGVVGVLFIDLDNFKLINDSFGHAAGDAVLQSVTSRLLEATREMDVVSRQGGDEFLILVSDLNADGREPARSLTEFAPDVVATRVRNVLADPIALDGVDIYLTASTGISLYPIDALDSGTLLKHADVAMYSVKQSGRDGHKLYAFGADTALEQISMASRLRKTLDDGQGLVLHYQPVVELESGRLVGAEALIRWQDGRRGLTQPDEFIPLAERTGLIGAISDWVIQAACRQASTWREMGIDLYVSINLPPSYCQPTGMNHLLATASTAGVDLDRLVIEVTESALTHASWQAIEPKLADLRKRGLKLAIDDFGTGYSSLGRLDRSWVSMLKMDRTFVKDVPGDEHARALIGSVVHLAQSLGLEPIAEGVETELQRRFLVEHGCRIGQGTLFSPPVRAAEIEELWARNDPLARKSA
jgi:diguanylate cyclase (GGDEF)-like protein/PAS domain S-box-containing protein